MASNMPRCLGDWKGPSAYGNVAHYCNRPAGHAGSCHCPCGAMHSPDGVAFDGTVQEALVDEAGQPYPILSDDDEEVVLNDKDVASLRWLLGGPA